MTVQLQPQDAIFVDFEKNWRQFVSDSPMLALPVLRVEPTEVPEEEPWEPAVKPECVYSQDAGGFVPQVTILWNEFAAEEPVELEPQVPAAAAAQVGDALATGPPGAQTPAGVPPADDRATPPAAPGKPGSERTTDLRFDLAVHQNGFDRGFYSTALDTGRLERFNLPAGGALASDTEAVLLTGPSLFPRLMDYRSQALEARDTQRHFVQRTLVLRDLSEGLTYRIRISSFGGQSWNEERQVVFLTPVCPDTF